MNLQVFDMNGKLIKSSIVIKDQEPYHASMDLSELEAGPYLLQFVLADGKRITERFIKN